MKLIKSGAPNTRQHRDGPNPSGDTGRTSLAPRGAYNPRPLPRQTAPASSSVAPAHWRMGSGSMRSVPTTNVVATSISSKSSGMPVTTNELPGGVVPPAIA